MNKIDTIVNRAFSDEKYMKLVFPIINSFEFQQRKKFKHHDDCSVYEHCIIVSYVAYRYCLKCGFNYYDAAIGGLLHDFYSKPWQEYLGVKQPFFKQHGFTHAADALNNAYKFFPEYINDRVADIILRHMFPLNIRPPKYVESWIVTFIDKKVSLGILKPNKRLLKYLGISYKN